MSINIRYLLSLSSAQMKPCFTWALKVKVIVWHAPTSNTLQSLKHCQIQRLTQMMSLEDLLPSSTFPNPTKTILCQALPGIILLRPTTRKTRGRNLIYLIFIQEEIYKDIINRLYAILFPLATPRTTRSVYWKKLVGHIRRKVTSRSSGWKNSAKIEWLCHYNWTV